MSRGPSWKLQDAKARLSELIERAMQGHPQRISRRGKDAVVVIRVTDFEAATKPKESLVEFFAQSPHRDIEVAVTRRKDVGREVSL
jgi:prevent-host-death family protein